MAIQKTTLQEIEDLKRKADSIKADIDKLPEWETELETLEQQAETLRGKIAAVKNIGKPVAQTVSPTEPQTTEKTTKTKRQSGGTRRQKGERAGLIKDAQPTILNTLKSSNVPMKTGAIADAIKKPKDITAAALKALVEAGTVTAKGERAQTVYSAVN